MKIKYILFTIVLLIALTPVSALAKEASVTGSIEGYFCVTQGKTCPVGKEDPMAAVETAFVLHVKDSEYYFVPNVDRAVLARHINDMVRVEGDMSKDRKAIHAKEIFVNEGGKWMKVWSSNLEDDIYRDVWGTLLSEVNESSCYRWFWIIYGTSTLTHLLPLSPELLRNHSVSMRGNSRRL